VVLVGVYCSVLAALEFLLVLLEGVSIVWLQFALLSFPLVQLQLLHIVFCGVINVFNVLGDFMVWT